jgi:hypothetical protein
MSLDPTDRSNEMKTLPTNVLATALLSRLDTVKASIVERIVSDYNRAAARLAVTRTVRVWNSQTLQMESLTVSGWGFEYNDRARRWNRTDGDLTKFAAHTYAPTFHDAVYTNEIDMAKVEAAAQAEAEATCLAWYKKLTCKLGEVESATLHYSGVGSYCLTVTKAGVSDSIRIDQQIVWKVSSRGSWFAQFPARIYVGGKFTPEAKFKAQVAA